MIGYWIYRLDWNSSSAMSLQVNTELRRLRVDYPDSVWELMSISGGETPLALFKGVPIVD